MHHRYDKKCMFRSSQKEFRSWKIEQVRLTTLKLKILRFLLLWGVKLAFRNKFTTKQLTNNKKEITTKTETWQLEATWNGSQEYGRLFLPYMST